MRRFAIFIALAALVSVSSCEERTPAPFMDISGVYFNNLSSTMTVTDSLDLTFVYESSDRMEVPVAVQLMGRTSASDRPVSISVTSPDAEEGVDYILPENAVMPAGAYGMTYGVTLLRTEALKSGRKMICLEIRANGFFDLPVREMAQVADTVSLLSLKIYFSDMFTQAPEAWDENLVGEFTQQKFELICRVLEIDPADFNDPGVMTLARLLFISAEMTAYIAGEKEKKDAGLEYDMDAFDPQTGEPLNFR